MQRAEAARPVRWAVPAFLAVALLAGGGGSPAPLAELVVQLDFAASVAVLVWQGRIGPSPPRALWLLAGTLIAVPALQLLPMPPQWWRALPGRDLATASFDLAGSGGVWRPLALVPGQTLASALALVPPLGVMLLLSRSSHAERRAVLLVMAGAGLARVLLGALQITGGGWRIYEPTHSEWLTGFFANRNAAAVQFVLSGLALSAWAASAPPPGQSRVRLPPRREGAILVGLAQGVLALGVVLTGSRAGSALLVLSLPLHWFILRGRVGTGRDRRQAGSSLAGSAGRVAGPECDGAGRVAGRASSGPVCAGRRCAV